MRMKTKKKWTGSAVVGVLLGWCAGMPAAHADIRVEFECTIPASEGFDCNLLKQRFFEAKAIPFVKAGVPLGRKDYAVKVRVSRLPVLNGHEFKIEAWELADPSRALPAKRIFVSDGSDATAALIEINKRLQSAVLAWSDQSDEASVSGGQVTVTYGDPQGAPAARKSEGRWIVQPGINANFSKYSGSPGSYYSNATLSFNHSGDRVRVGASANGYLNRQSVAVVEGEGDSQTQRLYGVTNHSGNAGGGVVIGLDRGNHVNVGAGFDVSTAPLANIDKKLGVGVGIEYNARPFLKGDSKSLAAGCTLRTGYTDLDVPNYRHEETYVPIMESCAIVGSLLLDKQRGTVISGQVGETWVLNRRDVFGIDGNISANIRLTDRWTVSPYVSFSKQTKSLVAASSDYAPSLDGLSGQELANETVRFQNQASSSASASISGNVSLSYTFGDGVNRSMQDKRGQAIR